MAQIENKSNITSKYALPDGSENDYSTVSNTTKTQNMTNDFKKTRTSEKDTATNGEEVKQTLTLKNDSPLEIKNVRIKEVVSQNGKIKDGSVEIDGTKYESFSPQSGFTLPNSILPNAEVTVTYVLAVDADPTGDVVNMQTEINYTVETTEMSDKAGPVTINLDIVKVTIEKLSSQTVAIKGQNLVFEHTITNVGNVKVTQVTFKDPLPSGVTFVKDSVTVDTDPKVGYDPTKGFSIKDLEPNDKVIVRFNVVVN